MAAKTPIITVTDRPALYSVSNPRTPHRASMKRSPEVANAPSGLSVEDDFINALVNDGKMTAIGEIPLSLKLEQPNRGNKDAAEIEAQLGFNVELEQAEATVALLEQGGRLSWHFPNTTSNTETGGRRRGGALSKKRKLIAEFRIDMASVGDTTHDRSGEFLKGQIASRIFKKARVTVFKFATHAVAGSVMRFLERNIDQGIVQMSGADVGKWRRIPDLSIIGQVDSRERPRILLFVHGTFSSTAGSFGDLATFSFLEDARSKYDLIIGFDHRTLSLSPEENAIDLLESLIKAPWLHNAIFDGVAFSRGGLVLRSLIETVLPNAEIGIAFDSAIFVGCTNNGTLLARRENWIQLLDQFTNLMVSGSRLASLLTSSPVPHAISHGVVGLSSFAKFLMQTVADEQAVPGIVAMEPNSPFLLSLNQLKSGQPGPNDTAYFAVTSDFENKLFNIASENTAVQRMALSLCDPIVDRLMGDDNDLVVNTRSMTNIGAHSSDFFKETMAFGTNSWVFHTVYFAHPNTCKALRQWLKVPGEEAAPPQPTARSRVRNKSMALGDAFYGLKDHFSRDLPADADKIPQRRKSKVEIIVEWNDVAKADGDVLAVGHYRDVIPKRAEHALDCAVSGCPTKRDYWQEFVVKNPPGDGDDRKQYEETFRAEYEKKFGDRFLLRNLTETGRINGSIGQVEFYPWGGKEPGNRVVAICGMGIPGRFDESHLRRLYRNLVQIVNDMSRSNLTTVLIGSGDGALSIRSSVRGMLRGLDDALGARSEANEQHGIKRVRIVEFDKARAHEIHHELSQLIASNERHSLLAGDTTSSFGLDVHLKSAFRKKGGRVSHEHRLAYLLDALYQNQILKDPADSKRQAVDELLDSVSANKKANVSKEELRASLKSALEDHSGTEEKIANLATRIGRALEEVDSDTRVTTRVSFTKDQNIYRVSAISDAATKPERIISTDPELISEVAHKMFELGRNNKALDGMGSLLARLMVPFEFGELLDGTNEPIIIEVDRDTAELHWETLGKRHAGDPLMVDSEEPISLSRPVSRQLRTPYSPPPRLRKARSGLVSALVIGDPGDPEKGHHLPGARNEAIAVVNILKSHGIKVTPLIGAPTSEGDSYATGFSPATRIAVLQALHENDFDLIHYAGHGDYDKDDPSRKGWLFSNGMLTAGELERFDTVPPLVVANACLSALTSATFAGDTQKHRARAPAALLPSLADEFMRRGVWHYVGTAWEVSDVGAVQFARTFYDYFLGTDRKSIGEAMLEARKVLAQDATSSLWAAYQHYGSPTFRWD